MKKLMALLVALLAVAVAGALLVFVPPGAAAPRPQNLEVYVAAGEPTHVDESEPGLGPGDWLLFRDPVLDAAGEEIGTAVTRVQIISPAGNNDVAFILDCTVELGDGGLVFTGAERLSHLETEVSYAVAGGTGSFAGASGQVTGAHARVNGQPASRLTFELAKK